MSGLKRYSVGKALPYSLAASKPRKYADESMQIRLPCVEPYGPMGGNLTCLVRLFLKIRLLIDFIVVYKILIKDDMRYNDVCCYLVIARVIIINVLNVERT